MIQKSFSDLFSGNVLQFGMILRLGTSFIGEVSDAGSCQIVRDSPECLRSTSLITAGYWDWTSGSCDVNCKSTII